MKKGLAEGTHRVDDLLQGLFVILNVDSALAVRQLQVNLLQLLEVLDELVCQLDVLEQHQLELSELRHRVGVVGLGDKLDRIVESVGEDGLGGGQTFNESPAEEFSELRELLLSFEQAFVVPISLDDVAEVDEGLESNGDVLDEGMGT